MTAPARAMRVDNTALARPLGYSLGPAGACVRLVAGGLAIAATIRFVEDAHSTLIVEVLAGFVGTTLLYLALFAGLGGRVVSRVDPWIGTAVLLAPFWARQLLPIPDAARQGVLAYVGVGLVVDVALGYGGCEVVAIPTALLRRRYVVYCPYNMIDAAERSLTQTRGGRLHALALAIAVIGGTWFLVFVPLLDQLNISVSIPDRWALLLLVPAGILVVQLARSASRREHPGATLLGVGALVYLALSNAGVLDLHPWPMVIAVGLVSALGRAAVALRRSISLPADHRGNPDRSPVRLLRERPAPVGTAPTGGAPADGTKAASDA
jgi:Family of unknown function (DUF6410)